MSIVYLHGFNSGPASRKARELAACLDARGLGSRFECPQLPHRPREAIATAEAALARHPGATLVGSSLGGFYATWLAERHDLRAVLVNPAVQPQADLESFLGVQRNLYSGAQYELTREHLDEWRALVVASLRPERYLLLVETGDETLDYRHAVRRYAGARQVVIEGGDHSLASFPAHLTLILEFAGLAGR